MKIQLIIAASIIILGACKQQNSQKTETDLNKVITEQPLNNGTAESIRKNEVDKTNMIYFSGGNFPIGNQSGQPNEQPVHDVMIKPFYMDKNLVTVAEFRKFIKETNYKTDADKFGDSGVFDFTSGQWMLLPGANWEKPLGPKEEKAKDNHPVTHVSWKDAFAYAKWAGKRLPTEAEWEYAAKSGNPEYIYPWGKEVKKHGKFMANTFQGTLEDLKTEDGYLHSSPVASFPANEAGLFDMSGNVWQWTSTIYESYPGSYTPVAPQTEIRVTRGGSFMFDPAGDASFTTTFRAQNTTETSLFNTGFRCVADAE